tara:strand:- start:371 stop:1105 length:735 start_codon:yes stop_codon:yes gene_type:complete
MNRWRRINQLWCNWPSKPIGLVEMIGGSYLAATPHLSYKRLLEGLSDAGFAIHAWAYIPGFDHQSQANEAWKEMRSCKNKLEDRIGFKLKAYRIGHSLGCKLHLLAPDGGRNSHSLVSISFNNYNANRSIPLISKLASKLNVQTEFSPSPRETIKLIQERYKQPKNLIIKFDKDNLDQSESLISCLKQRGDDSSTRLILRGDHLTPASAGIRHGLLGNLANDQAKAKNIKELINAIKNYSIKNN